VLDRRAHVGGNAYDERDGAGILVHRYGPHIFHTNSQDVVDYLSAFTAWRPYEHRVLAHVGGRDLPFPINRTTLNLLNGLSLSSEAEAEAYLQSVAEPVSPVSTSEDVVVGRVGRALYESFFRGYTRKQWGLDPSQLDASVTARVPVRTNLDDRYFTDSFQAMPAEGYTALFMRMLDHPNITVATGVDFFDVREAVAFDRLVFTGPIDDYFGRCHGPLPYRSLTFRHETLAMERFQAAAVVNYPDQQTPHTRITEYKYLTGQQSSSTSISYEYPADDGDPYYPVPRAENQERFRAYQAMADALPDVLFVGRLATYRYYNMDQVVAQALATYRRAKR
jgi:UDP-galactopyranose mutase